MTKEVQAWVILVDGKEEIAAARWRRVVPMGLLFSERVDAVRYMEAEHPGSKVVSVTVTVEA